MKKKWNFILLMIVLLILTGCNQTEIITTEISPNSFYLAEVTSHNHGATGGSTQVNITAQTNSTTMNANRQQVYLGAWGEFDEMTLEWQSNSILAVHHTSWVSPLLFTLIDGYWQEIIEVIENEDKNTNEPQIEIIESDYDELKKILIQEAAIYLTK